MVSDKRSGPQGGPGAMRGPGLAGTRPGSVNRGFASVDPERQRESGAGAGEAAVDGGAIPEDRRRRVPAGVPAAQPGSVPRARAEPGADAEGGSA